MNDIQEIYRKMIEDSQTSRQQFKESNLCVFSMGVGRKSEGKLLVVGRATNGWRREFEFLKEDIESCRRISGSLNSIIGSENLDWVTQQWGSKHKYNTRKSQFWRLSRMLARRIASDSDDCIDYICWSNLFKIVPSAKGNPSKPLTQLQFDSCVEVLRLEIESSKAQNVVFLTGYNWAKPFLDQLNVSHKLETVGFEFVEFISAVGGVNYVVGQHPQGKKEQPHCEEIVRAFCLLANLQPSTESHESGS